ncbi:MAG: flippase-like domain-containing protein [Patescibacteria group bacterium]|nr:flippase-like domain-containing protein [Patescibacteria group bacterium]
MRFRKFFLFFISLFLGIIFVLYLFHRVGFRKVFHVLSLLHWWQLMIIFFINLFVLFLMIKKWQILVSSYGYRSGLKKLIPAFLSEQAISYLTPVMYIGGEGFKAYLIKKNENKSFVETFGLIVIDRMAEGAALLIFLTLGGIVSLLVGSYLLGFFLLIASLIIFILIIIIFRLPNILRFFINFFQFQKVISQEINEHQTLERKINEEINIIQKFFQHGKKLFHLDIILSLVIILLSCLQIYFLMFFWGQSLDIFKIYLIRIFGLLSGFIPTPGSIGGFEGAIAFIFAILKLNLEHALSFALVIRVCQLVFVALGVLFLIPYLTKLVFPLIFKNNH